MIGTLPETMIAIAIERPGGPKVLRAVNVPRSVPQEGEVLIEVHAAGVNRPDILQRVGAYPVPKGASPLPGLEVAGTVVETGSDAGTFKSGDRVVALTNGGGYAEYVAVPEGQMLPLPDGYSMVEGAALPETFFTAQQTLIDRAGLIEGQIVLVHGASGGLGATALQLARLRGATPYATASSPEKADYARKMGAEDVIDYVKNDFVLEIRSLTGGRGVDMVFDILGGDYLERNLRALAHRGTIIQLALLAGLDANVDLTLILSRHATVFGSTLRPLSSEAKAEIAAHLKEQVWPALSAGRLQKPHIETFALENAADAHRAMDARGHFGKVVLVTQAGSA